MILQILLYNVLEKLLHNINNFHKTRSVSKILLTLTFFSNLCCLTVKMQQKVTQTKPVYVDL